MAILIKETGSQKSVVFPLHGLRRAHKIVILLYDQYSSILFGFYLAYPYYFPTFTLAPLQS